MAYFEDLTPYAYILGKWTEQPVALNVGWLDKSVEYLDGRHEFEIGPVPLGFTERLAELVEHPVNLCRGWHNCWCGHAQGNGEIRVTGADGVVYAAPVLIAHYVTAHGYRPPTAFIDAVLSSEKGDRLDRLG